MSLQLSAPSVALFLYLAWASAAPPTPTPAPPVQFLAPTGGGWKDPAIIAAIIVVITTIITSITSQVYHIRHTRKIEGEKVRLRRLHSRETVELQRQHEEEMERFRRELDVQYREKEQEEKREEAARQEMLTAQNNTARAVAYRKALHVDPQISRLQILDMQHPLDMANIYVRVRVHEDTLVRYAIDPALTTAEERRDPDTFFQARHHNLEQRVGSAVDPDVALRKYRRCVVVGDPGAGKTTLLKYLTLTLAEGKHPDISDLPIHVELNGFVYSEEQDVLDYTARRWDERYAFPKAEARNYMDTVLRDGKAILLLDALDETVVGEQPAQANASHQKAWNAIMSLATRYPQACIVVTARKAGYQQHRPLDGFTVVEMMDFRQEDIRQFVEKWFQGGRTQAASADDLITLLKQNPRIQELATNPLLLSLIVQVYEAQLDMPDRRVELYRECVEVLLAKWDAKRDIRRLHHFKPDRKRQLLAEVAWHVHQQGRRYFPEQDLLAEIAQFLPSLGLSTDDSQQVLQEIVSRNGLLKEQAHGLYGFLHLTLQEYFTALAITDQSRFTTLVSQCADPWWEEVLLLYAGQTPDASSLLLSLLGKDSSRPQKDDLFHTHLLMAGRCLTSIPTIRQKNLREEVIERVVNLFLQTSYSHLRSQIRDILVMIGGVAVTSRLVQLVRDDQIDIKVRAHIALTLGQLGERSVETDQLEMLKDSRIDSKLRRSIARVLGREFVLGLVEMLKDSQIADVHIDILGTLGELGKRSAMPELVEMLKDDQISDSVRSNIALALGQLEKRSVVPSLVEMLKDDRISDSVRSNIALALGQLGERAVVQDLVEMLKDNQIDSRMRRNIAWALGLLGEKSVVQDLVEMLKDSQIARGIRGNIAVALGKLGEKSVVLELVEMLKDGQITAWVRVNITWALGLLGEKSVVPDLVEMLKDSQIDTRVRGQVAWALGMLGEGSVVPDLVEMLKNNQIESGVRKKIAEALGNLAKDEQTMKACVLLLPHTPTFVADEIYSALWNMSRWAKVTIIVRDDGDGETVEFVPWQSGVKGLI